MILRDYQHQALADLRRSLSSGHSRPVLQLPTGGGKTVIASAVCHAALAKHSRVLILAPRRELVYQFRDTLREFGITAGTVMAGEPVNVMLPIQVASLDTLSARAIRSNRMRLPDADVVVVDEAHLAITKKRLEILERYPRVIGLTATPARGDGKGLGQYFDDLVLGPPMRKLVDDGYLVPARYYAPTVPDLENLKIARGDYQVKPLSDRMSKPDLIGDIVQHWRQLAADRQTVVFCVDRAHARAVAAEFSGCAKTEYLDGETETEERKAIIARIKSGESQVLVNVFVATYGLDIPCLSCAVLARPTKSIVLYLQTVGRVLRTHESKSDALVIDHAGAVHEHGFADEFFPWSLDGNMREAKQREREERQTPKEITCGECSTVFKGRRDCPNCGAELIPPSKPIPFHEGQLEEVKLSKVADKRNRDFSAEEKFRVFCELSQYAKGKGYASGWVNHKYREYFGVWPNRFRNEEPQPVEVSDEIASWIRSRNIAWAKRKAA